MLMSSSLNSSPLGGGCAPASSLPLIIGALLSVIIFSSQCSYGFQIVVIEQQRLPGVWKLVSSCLPFEEDIRSKLTGILTGQHKEEILIKLNNDGTFRQCNEDYREGKWISGRWKLQEADNDNDNDSSNNNSTTKPTPTLLLAFNRQYFGPPYDVLLEGKIYCDDDNHNGSLEVRGEVCTGKFVHPISKDTFFDETPVLGGNPKLLGTFTMESCLPASLLSDFSSSSMASEIGDQEDNNQFQTSLIPLYGQTQPSLLLLIEPCP